MAGSGWIKLHRQLQDCWVWNEKPFSKGQAWVDLILIVNREDKTTPIDGKPVLIKRGQKHTSTVILANRWGWDRRKVGRFLDCLEKDSMLVQERTRSGTTITIVNYGVYQCNGTTDGTTNGTADGTTNGTTDGTQTRNKEIKKERNIYTPQMVVDLYHSICISFPEVKKLSDARKRSLTTRLKKYSLDDFKTVFEKAEASSFLKGSNGWKASFDWLINEANMLKVMEGNYDDKDSSEDWKAKMLKVLDDDW